MSTFWQQGKGDHPFYQRIIGWGLADGVSVVNQNGGMKINFKERNY